MEIEMSPRLKDTLKALWGIKETDSKDQEGSPMEISINILDGAWADFENWICSSIGGDFRWSARPRDTRNNRQMVADSIEESIRRNNGSFPQRNAFMERQES